MRKKELKKLAELEAELLDQDAGKKQPRKCGRKVLLLAIVAVDGVMAARALKRKAQPLPPGNGTVTLRDAEPGPLAFMMSEMVKGFIRDPYKRKLADKMNVSVAIQDLDHPEMAATMIFKASDVEVANGVIEGVDVYIGTELALLLSLSGAGKGKQMLEWLKSEDGRKVVKAVRSGRFKVRGAVRNVQQIALFQKFLTPAG